MIQQGSMPVGEIELRELEQALNVQINICYDRLSATAQVPLTIALVCNSSQATWSVDCNDNVGLLKYYYNSITYCYQFLDKIFDEGVFQLFPMANGYIPQNEKNRFFEEFRKYFPDEESQLYGWRGLRNWVVKKDNEYRKKGRDGLDHTTPEFDSILKMLYGLSLHNLNVFIKYTSISRRSFHFLKKKSSK